MKQRTNLLGFLGSVSALALAAPGMAFAQSATGEIVVTAQRRAAAVNDVPAAIDVLGGEELRAAGAIDSITLQNTVPGLQISRETGLQTQIYLRGIGNNITGLSSSNSVATYVDGVYVSNSLAAFQRFSDVERIEVLKGPQAVLYGRNATGGAVLVVSRAPSFTPEFSADASAGNFDMSEFRASVSGPLAGDFLAGRLSVRYFERDGYFTNLTTGQTVDDEVSLGVRGALLFRFSPTFEVTVRADYSDSETADFLKITNQDAWEFTLRPDNYEPDPWAQAYDLQPSSGMQDSGALVNVSWETGIGEITSITSYREFETDPTFSDLDSYAGVTLNPYTGLPFLSPLAQLGDVVTSQNIWHETYLATDPNQMFSLIAGFNYSKEDGDWLSRRQSSPTLFPAAIRISEVEAYSVFADVNFNITRQFSIGAGLRYSEEDRYYSQQRLDPTTLAPTGPVAFNQGSYSSLNPRLGVEFRRTEGELWYFNYSTGFKSGGFSETAPADSFEPEEVQSYELGLKREWFDGRLQTNASAFYYDYTDLQVQRIVFPAASRLIDNADSATIQGIDFSIRGEAADGLILGVNVEYLKSEYGDLFLCNDLVAPCVISGVPNPAANINAAGNQMQRAPELSAVFTLDWEFSLGSLGALRTHFDTKYTSRTYFSPYEADIHSRAPYWVANGEVRYEPNDSLYVALFGHNLTDELYEQQIVNSGNQYHTDGRFIGNAPHYLRWAPPRTYGVRVGVNF